MSEKNNTILILSSQVVSGQVGLTAITPGLRALEFETVALPTTLLSAHPAAFPDMAAPAGGPLPVADLMAMVDWLVAAGALDNLAGILTGYMPSLAHVSMTREIVARMKADHPELVYCCDPICGDQGRLYLDASIADAVRTELLPLADIATPNLFELSHFTGLGETPDNAAVVKAARSLNVPHLVVTSAPAAEGRIATLAIGQEVQRCETAGAPRAPHGMGDLFAALYLGLHLHGEAKKLGTACGTLASIAARNVDAATLPHGPVSLSAPALQDTLVIQSD